MNILVLATRNKGKTRELREALKEFPIDIKNLDDFGPIPEIEEDGESFDENAYKKAAFAARILGYSAMADDSGLVVEALEGRPGVRSARYAGENATDEMNVAKLIQEMQDVQKMQNQSNRKAAFECVISIAVPTGAALTYEGRCEGLITDAPRGENGFGYDPVFFYPDFGKTFAEVPMEEKSSVSHRGKALQEVTYEFDKILDWLDINMPQFEPIECKL